MRLASSSFFLVALLGLSACAGNDSRVDPCSGLCGAGLCCGGACANPQTDNANCGGCGIACGAGLTCQSGMCRPGTPIPDGGTNPNLDAGDGNRCCGTNCFARTVPPGTDGRSHPSFANCLGCGLACNATRANSCSVPGGGTTGTARCMCGEFDQCLDGDTCVNEGGTWQCINTSTDPRNCGGMGNACADGEICTGGMCQCGSTGARCTTGQSCCAGSCIDTTADAMNCGGCGVRCGPNNPDCVASMCRCGSAPTSPICRTAMAGGGSGLPFPIPLPGIGGAGDPGQLCCSGTCMEQSTGANCGECGAAACSGDDVCSVSSGGFLGMGGGVEVCCADPLFAAIVGCAGDSFPIPIPGADGGGFGFDAGIPFP